MKVDRRHVLQTGLSLTAGLFSTPAWAAGKPRFKAMAFDAFPVFDPRPIAALAETAFPGRGAEVINLWRIRQFEYTWLRTVAGRLCRLHARNGGFARFRRQVSQA